MYAPSPFWSQRYARVRSANSGKSMSGRAVEPCFEHIRVFQRVEFGKDADQRLRWMESAAVEGSLHDILR